MTLCQRAGVGKTKLVIELGMNVFPVIFIYLGRQFATHSLARYLKRSLFSAPDTFRVDWTDGQERPKRTKRFY